MAINQLGNGLSSAHENEDALLVREAELSMRRRFGASEDAILVVQSNLAHTYDMLGRHQEALCMKRDVYFGRLKLNGEEHAKTLQAGNNYANLLVSLEHDQEAKALLCKMIPVARRVLGEGNRVTLKMRWHYAKALILDDGATLNDLHEAVTTLEDTARIARRMLGGAHPITREIEESLRRARAALRAREETPPAEDLAEEVD